MHSAIVYRRIRTVELKIAQMKQLKLCYLEKALIGRIEKVIRYKEMKTECVALSTKKVEVTWKYWNCMIFEKESMKQIYMYMLYE